MDAATQNYIGATVTTLFPVLVVLIGSLIAAARTHRRGGDALETAVRWWLIGGLVVGAVTIALTFWIIPAYLADSMAYPRSPFQFEVSMTNLAFAVMGAWAVRVVAARLVVVVGFCVFMWGALLGHLDQRLAHHNTSPGNGVGIWVYDLAVPMVLLVLVLRQHRHAAVSG